MPSASLRSVLMGMVFKAPFTCRVFIRTASSAAFVSPRCCHCDKGPASRPRAAMLPTSACIMRFEHDFMQVLYIENGGSGA